MERHRTAPTREPVEQEARVQQGVEVAIEHAEHVERSLERRVHASEPLVVVGVEADAERGQVDDDDDGREHARGHEVPPLDHPGIRYSATSSSMASGAPSVAT